MIDVENLLNTYSHVLNPHSQAGSLQYQILSKSIKLSNSFYHLKESTQLSSEIKEANSIFDEVSQLVDLGELYTQDFKYQLVSDSVNKFNFYEHLSSTFDKENNVSIVLAKDIDIDFIQDPSVGIDYQLTSVNSEDKDKTKKNSISDEEFSELSVTNGEADLSQTLIAEYSDTSFYPPVAAGGGSGGGGGGESNLASSSVSSSSPPSSSPPSSSPPSSSPPSSSPPRRVLR